MGQEPFESGSGFVNDIELNKGKSAFEGLMLEKAPFVEEYSGFRNLENLGKIRGKISKSDIQNTISVVGLNARSKNRFVLIRKE